MRALFVFGIVTLVLAQPAAIQPFPPNPTHAMEFTVSNATTTPSRGGATPSFTRTTASSNYTTSALITAVGTGTAVIGSPLSSGTLQTSKPTGVYVGDLTEFVLIRNEDLSAAAWAASGTPTVLTDVATTDPLGSTTSDSVEDNDAGADEYLSQSVTITSDTTSWTTTVWAYCASSHTARIILTITGGTETAGANDFTCNTTWTRQSFTLANNGSVGNTTARVELHPTNGVASNTGTALFIYPQLYNLGYVIPLDTKTTTAAVTVNADALTYSAVPASETGTVCAWVWVSGGSGGVFQWDGTDDLVLYIRAGVEIVLTSNSTLTNNLAVTTSTTVTAATWTHVCAVWGFGTQAQIYVNGAEAAYSGQDQTYSTDEDFGTTLTIGDASAAGVGRPEGFISDFRYFAGKALSASAIKRIYNQPASKAPY